MLPMKGKSFFFKNMFVFVLIEAFYRKIEAFYATNDLIDIFRCFLPISYEQNLAENPTRAMLFYNDCEYLAYVLMDLNHEVSKHIPSPLSHVSSYLDSIPLIRRSGENALLILMVNLF